MQTPSLIGLATAALLMLSIGMVSATNDSYGFTISVEGDNINVTHTEELLGGAGYNLTFAPEDKMNAFILSGVTVVKAPIKWDVPTVLIPIPSDVPRGEWYYATLWITALFDGELKTIPVAGTWISN